MAEKLFKTTLMFWSRHNTAPLSLGDLIEQVTVGDANGRVGKDELYCSKRESKLIREPVNDPDWDFNHVFEPEEG